LRLYEMFMGPFDQPIAWGEENILGVRRFLERIWRIAGKVNRKAKIPKNVEIILHKTIKKVSEDIENMSFNTAISAMMILLNEIDKLDEVNQKDYELFLKILSPFAPHIAEELWNSFGNKKSILLTPWPKADPKKMKEAEVKLAVQVNSKVRGVVFVPNNAPEDEAIRIARSEPGVEKWLMGKEIKKIIYVPNRILNILI